MLIQSASADSAPAIDLTPVIDMVFLLLIFFLVATTFQQVEREMKIALPQTQAAGPISASLREIIINIDEQGQAIVAGRAIADADLDAMIRAAVERNPSQKISVRGDRRALYEHVARVLDLCKHAGIAEPYLETRPIR